MKNDVIFNSFFNFLLLINMKKRQKRKVNY
jgi:hypothetical protein